MKSKASDYLFELLKSYGVETVFCVTGGASAHLMESVRTLGFETVHCYHEQACAMAADAYARIKKKPAVVLVTNGPGASNTLTGVLGAYQDSIPMIVISGQVPRRQMIASSGSNLRQYGVQEAEIISIVKGMTKFAVHISDSAKLPEISIKAFTEATTGRMGPVWLEIPLDVQSEMIEVDEVKTKKMEAGFAQPKATVEQFNLTAKEISLAKRPVIIAGAGIHLANCESEFKKLVNTLGIPVVCTWNATDLFSYEDELYIGNFGILGERSANLALQNADLLLILGSRMSIPNVGYATDLFSPKSKKIMIDIDRNEIEKKSLSIDIPIVADVRDFVLKLSEFTSTFKKTNISSWIQILTAWKKRFVVFNEEHRRGDNAVNSYDFIEILSRNLSKKDVVVTDMGTSFTCTMQALRNNGSNRLFTSSACCSMGFGLPGAIGAYYANKENRIICIAGDGGFQMNLQELQTIAHNCIPVKIFILNSNGYLAISLMQDNLFAGKHFGSTPDSGVSAPSFARIAEAYGIPSRKVTSMDELQESALREVLDTDGPYLCEVMIPNNQLMIPRVQSLKDAEGRIMSGSIDSMFPYLPESELEKIKDELAQSSD